MEWITSFYQSSSHRTAELEKALVLNIANKAIRKIHLFVDNEAAQTWLQTRFKSAKISVVRVGPQPLYADIFAFANTLPAGTVCAISNADIWLKAFSDMRLVEMIRVTPKQMFALTRYESDMTSPLIDTYRGSHDTFIFASPIDTSILKHIRFPQNVWGSENVLLYEMKKLGFTVLNPCRQLQIVHEHVSEERNPGRERINFGDYDGDGVFKRRSEFSPPIVLNFG
jgi:hypothetical protein